MSVDTQTFQSPLLELTVQRHPGCTVHFDVRVLPQAVSSALVHATKQVNKDVVIPGFRKGKAPMDLITKQYASQIKKTGAQLIAQGAFEETVRLSKIVPYTKEASVRLHEPQMQPDGSCTLTIEFDAYPKVPTIDLHQLPLEKKVPEAITDILINERLHEVQLAHAQWETVENRPIEEGDWVVIDITLFESENTPEPICAERRVLVKTGTLQERLHQLLLGKMAGTSASEEGLPRYETYIHRIEKPILPDLNDLEFLKKIGAKSAEELQSRARKMLDSQAQTHARSQMRQELAEKLLETYPFDLPKAQLETWKQAIKEWVSQFPEEEQENLAKNEQKKIETMWRLRYLLLDFLRDHNIPFPSDELLSLAVMQENAMHSMQGHNARTQEEAEQKARQIRFETIITYALDALLDRLLDLPTQEKV